MPGVRLIVQFTAESKDIADQAIAAAVERCKSASQEPGCLQFEVFRSELRPEHYVLLEHWDTPEALADHAQRNRANPPPARLGVKRVREDYEYAVSQTS